MRDVGSRRQSAQPGNAEAEDKQDNKGGPMVVRRHTIRRYSAFMASFCLSHSGQYQEAGLLTGLGPRLRYLAQRYRLPFTAAFGLAFFPLLEKFFGIGTLLDRECMKETCVDRHHVS
jgi:hypothetical protein